MTLVCHPRWEIPTIIGTFKLKMGRLMVYKKMCNPSKKKCGTFEQNARKRMKTHKKHGNAYKCIQMHTNAYKCIIKPLNYLKP